jgi:hypothetical protein
MGQLVPIVPQKGSFIRNGQRCVWFSKGRKGKRLPEKKLVCFRLGKSKRKKRPSQGIRVKGMSCKLITTKRGHRVVMCPTGKGATGWTQIPRSAVPRLFPL